MIREYIRRLVAQAFEQGRPALVAQVHEELRAQFASEANANKMCAEQYSTDMLAFNEARFRNALVAQMYVPNLLIEPQTDSSQEFMAYSTCNAADFFHPRFRELCKMIEYPLSIHRKVWE